MSDVMALTEWIRYEDQAKLLSKSSRQNSILQATQERKCKCKFKYECEFSVSWFQSCYTDADAFYQHQFQYPSSSLRWSSRLPVGWIMDALHIPYALCELTLSKHTCFFMNVEIFPQIRPQVPVYSSGSLWSSNIFRAPNSSTRHLPPQLEISFIAHFWSFILSKALCILLDKPLIFLLYFVLAIFYENCNP